MRHFRDLLKFDPASTPADEQRRASQGLTDAVARSHLQWWKRKDSAPVHGKCLLLAIAPFSQYDLILLDLLDERLTAMKSSMPVFVANLQDYVSVEQLRADFPGIEQPHQSPIAALCEAGSPKSVAWGKKARDMAAEALGLARDAISQRIAAESPHYAEDLLEPMQRK